MKHLAITLGLIFAAASPAHADDNCMTNANYQSERAHQWATQAFLQSQIDRLQAENAWLRQQLDQKSAAAAPPAEADGSSTPTTVRGNVPKRPVWQWPYQSR